MRLSKGGDPVKVFNEFFRQFQTHAFVYERARLKEFYAMIFPGGNVTEEIESAPHMPAIIDLVAWWEIAKGSKTRRARCEGRKMTRSRLEILGVPKKKFKEMYSWLDVLSADSKRTEELSAKSDALLQELNVENAELIAKHIGKFEETFGELLFGDEREDGVNEPQKTSEPGNVLVDIDFFEDDYESESV
ncbi:MAG: hypothetical protein Q4B29_01160 [Candidatus Saccharibacteria bacterium]|nr:hypothetical protein [Candidatus Saccharibacteria bacterium]